MNTHLATTLVALSLIVTGCPKDGGTENLAAPPPCASHMDKAAKDTEPDDAIKHIRGWLGCVATNERTMGAYDLEEKVNAVLDRNTMPGIVRAREEIIAHFFDNSAALQYPKSYPAMVAYVQQLEDQAQVARAQGDTPLAEAMEEQAKKVEKLGKILEDVVN